ncbi:G-D-S-L family lipolytic protein [Aphanothece hegewaldii CCALA 016]|uniref:G-D-S-L family lipolytic protein n=1 Tax=Aphanothece hegewaldii CCALA 016 TaxID=2107694 RepID=A0A2T1LVJ4_9CHRO|nr:GDSL-type esterase/lipase family protein [Aphanothece hegewaldii]PSF35740.1 G-D-S-L family lipolytic protein [Aphanothece hegewaldii CCALA 016]
MQTLATPNQLTHRSFQKQPLKIVALGDSLVYGYGDPQGGGWIERLRRQWMGRESADHTLYNLGIRGDRVIQVSERLEQEFRLRGELKNKVPDLIILSVGLNDSARLSRCNGKSFTDFETYILQISKLLILAQELCPVLFVGMIPVDESKMPFMNCLYYNHFDQYRYKEAAKKACLEKNIPYLDLFELWMARGKDWGRSQLSDDGLHPNTQGYQAILEDVLDWEAFANL